MATTITPLFGGVALDRSELAVNASGFVSSEVTPYTTFIGVDLGGGKGRNTAVALLRAVEDPHSPARVEVVEYGTGTEQPFYDDHLLTYLRAHPGALIAMDAPLSLPACVRCQLAVCPGEQTCDVPVVRWFSQRERDRAQAVDRKKPRYTPYTQRATEVLLHEGPDQILPRETLGQGMGPLTARASYLQRALRSHFTVGENLIEVYPKASLTRLVGTKLARGYKRSATAASARLEILNRLDELRFGLRAWREAALSNDHKFDAIICAYTGYLFSRGACEPPPGDVSHLVREDGWIWAPAGGKPPPA